MDSRTFDKEKISLEKKVAKLNRKVEILEEMFETRSRELYMKNVALQKASDVMKASLEEKATLLKEIHHRVKNNLQVIVSLMGLQSSTLKNPSTIELFRYTQDRVVSIAMIHEMLYESEDLSKINYLEYVQRLFERLISSMKNEDDKTKINLNLQIKDLKFNLDTSIPLGLLLNELTTNSIKYAFNNRSRGEISLKIEEKSEGHYCLHYSDDGIGIPETVSLEEPSTLGLQLINSLALQLEAEFKMKVDKGTHFILEFSEIVNE